MNTPGSIPHLLRFLGVTALTLAVFALAQPPARAATITAESWGGSGDHYGVSATDLIDASQAGTFSGIALTSGTQHWVVLSAGSTTAPRAVVGSTTVPADSNRLGKAVARVGEDAPSR